MLLRCHLALFDGEGAETLSSPGHVHRRAGRSRADHESNELSRKQLWLPSSALLLFGCSQRQNAAAAHGRERESRERRGKWGEQQQRGELTLLQYGARIEVESRRREERQNLAPLFSFFPIIPSLPPPNPFVFSSLPLHLLGAMLYMTFAKLEYSWSHYLLSAFCD